MLASHIGEIRDCIHWENFKQDQALNEDSQMEVDLNGEILKAYYLDCSPEMNLHLEGWGSLLFVLNVNRLNHIDFSEAPGSTRNGMSSRNNTPSLLHSLIHK